MARRARPSAGTGSTRAHADSSSSGGSEENVPMSSIAYQVEGQFWEIVLTSNDADHPTPCLVLIG